MFVEIGRLACEEHYQAGGDTITRWLEESGKTMLIEKRREFVKWNRTLLRQGRRDGWNRCDGKNRTHISPVTINQAAHFLRADDGCRMVVAPAQNGEWWIGSRRFKAHQLIAFAAALGFKPTLSRDAELRQKLARP